MCWMRINIQYNKYIHDNELDVCVSSAIFPPFVLYSSWTEVMLFGAVFIYKPHTQFFSRKRGRSIQVFRGVAGRKLFHRWTRIVYCYSYISLFAASGGRSEGSYIKDEYRWGWFSLYVCVSVYRTGWWSYYFAFIYYSVQASARMMLRTHLTEMRIHRAFGNYKSSRRLHLTVVFVCGVRGMSNTCAWKLECNGSAICHLPSERVYVIEIWSKLRVCLM